MPTVVQAAGSGRAMQSGASVLQANANSEKAATVYYGKNNSNSPAAWRVIGYNGSSGMASTAGNMTLLSAGNMGTSSYGNEYGGNNIYASSILKSKVNDIASKLTEQEQDAVVERTLEVGKYNGDSTAGVADTQVDNALLWPLSTVEAKQLNSSLRQLDTTNTGWAIYRWWLRSPGYYVDHAAYVSGNGNVDSYGGFVPSVYGVRPAFYLNLDSVLFTSAATGGKSGGSDSASAGALNPVSDYNGTEWKLTLLDKSREEFAIGTTGIDGNTLTVGYSGALVGENEYVSAVVTDGSKNLTYYGRLKHTATPGDENGTISVTLPDNFNSNTDTLYLFSEQYNGNKATDYASKLQKVSLEKNAYAIINNLTDITSSNPSTYRLMSEDKDYTADLSVTGDFMLPEEVLVAVDDTIFDMGADTYTYDSASGAFLLKASAINGDIIIEASGKTDIKAPNVTATVSDGENPPVAYTSTWTNNDVTFTVSGASAPSGIAKYQYSADGGKDWNDMTANPETAEADIEPASVTEAALTVSTESADTNGTSYIFRAVSNAGTEGTQTGSVVVKIDKTNPAVTVSGNTEAYLRSDNVAITASDELSGVARVEVSAGYSGSYTDITDSYESGYKITSNGTYTFRVTDEAGNEVTDSILYDKIDTEKPAAVITARSGSAPYTSGEWTNSDVTLSASNTNTANLGETGFEYKEGDGEWQTYNGSITISQDTGENGTVYTFRAISASGVESEEASITVKLDKTAPDGDIKIRKNSVKDFINNISFNLFFRESVDVEITAEDALSGMRSIEYHRSERILTEQDIAGISDWTDYASVISETAQDAEKFIYYVRITDQAGNVSCFASNGAAFDLTPPVISGVTEGEVYYTTQKVQAADANLDSVTVNDTSVAAETFLAGNTDATYRILAKDRADNESAVTVTMRPTASLAEAIAGITLENVTSEHEEKLQKYLTGLNIRLEDENATEEEKAIIQGLAEDAQKLLDRIEAARQAGSTEPIQKAETITPDTVMLTDRETLEAAQGDIEYALTNYGRNYTQEESARLDKIQQQSKTAIAVIQRVEAVESAIAALPDSVSPDDTETEMQIYAVRDMYNALSVYEQSLVSRESSEKLERLLAQLKDYRIIQGSSIWTRGSTAGHTVTANGAYSKFTGIKVDGEAVSEEQYMAESGSTVITLRPDYLSTLSTGSHTITVLYTDGEATGTFTVVEKPADQSQPTEPSDSTQLSKSTQSDQTAQPIQTTQPDQTTQQDRTASRNSASPSTGDDLHGTFLMMLMLISSGAAVVLVMRKAGRRGRR